jgi:hypothetical protein
MSQKTLSAVLLRRKELQDRLARMKPVMEATNRNSLFERQVNRAKIDQGVDEITVAIPKLTWSQFSSEYNLLSSQLRDLDGVIQQANWTTMVEVDDRAFKEHSELFPDIDAPRTSKV